jgi:YVTN family beta-propeller protein
VRRPRLGFLAGALAVGFGVAAFGAIAGAASRVPITGPDWLEYCGVGLRRAAQLPQTAPDPAARTPHNAAPLPGMPPIVDAENLYSESVAGRLSPAVADDLPRVYVPNRQSGDVYVIDPARLQVIDRFKVGINPQHVVPSWDLRTLWVANNAEGRPDGSLTPIDPRTGKPGRAIAVDDPYNMYFTPAARRRSWSPKRSSGSISAILTR